VIIWLSFKTTWGACTLYLPKKVNTLWELHKMYVVIQLPAPAYRLCARRFVPNPFSYLLYMRNGSTVSEQPLPDIKRAFSPPSIVLFQKCSHQNTCVCSSGWSGIDCSVSSPAWQSTFPTAPSPRGGGLTPPPAEDPGPTLSHTHVCKYIVYIVTRF
jgi:hypothetical protein